MAHNLLLALLPEHERARIAPYCERVELTSRQTLCEPDEPLAYAWFPQSGVCSALVYARSGDAVEVGIVGREGMVGIPLVLGEATNPFHFIVQVPGVAIRIAREPFLSAALAPQRLLCDALLKYSNLYLGTVAQTAVCNRLHRIEQRLARWLLDVRDRSDSDDLPLTHDFLALMLGAYRPSVSNAIKALQDREVIRARRGRVAIVDGPGLEGEACECHDIIKSRTATTLNEIRGLAA